MKLESPAPASSPSLSPTPSPSPCDCSSCISSNSSSNSTSDLAGWDVLWRDEFDGSELDYNNWDVQIARGCQYGSGSDMCGWGNVEQEFYADRTQNLRVEGGKLVITAMYESTPTLFPTASSPDAFYTSARIRTFRHYSVRPTAQYPTVRVEARIKVPAGTGLWPAFWMLPETGASASCSGCGKWGTWATSGEIDIAELRNQMTEVLGTVHYGGVWPNNRYITHTQPYSNGSLADGFHTYSLEWEAGAIRWYLDNVQYGASVPGSNGTGWYSNGTSAPAGAPFGGDQAFHILLNLAVGSPSTPFTGQGFSFGDVQAALATPQSMLVDWVRVYGWPAAA